MSDGDFIAAAGVCVCVGGNSLRRPAALIKRKLKRHLKFPRRSNEKREVNLFVSDLR